MANNYRNWHMVSQFKRAKVKPLSGVFPIQAAINPLTGDCSVSFQDAYGKQITFYLDSGTRVWLRQFLAFPKTPGNEELEINGSGVPVQ